MTSIIMYNGYLIQITKVSKTLKQKTNQDSRTKQEFYSIKPHNTT